MLATRPRASGWLGRLRDLATRALDDLAFPAPCPLCDADPREGRSGEGVFCPHCRETLGFDGVGSRCGRCGSAVGPWGRTDGGCSECRGESLGFDAAVVLGGYDEPLRSLCLRLKRSPGAWLAPWLADLFVEHRRDALREALAPGESPPLVVPVPLHWSRELRRGYNQSGLLAERLAKRLELPWASTLRRRRSTDVLAGKSRTERAELLRDAFLPRRNAAARVRGRTVLLVDDILTTGATCGAAARALKSSGARRVVVAVLARA